jgi:hypothetical protein
VAERPVALPPPFLVGVIGYDAAVTDWRNNWVLFVHKSRFEAALQHGSFPFAPRRGLN